MGMSPFAFVAWRAGVGAVVLAGSSIALVRRPRPDRRPAGASTGAPRAWLVVASVLGAALNLAAFLSFDNTTVALALLGFYTYPAMVAAGSVLLGRERLDPPGRPPSLLALAGMAAVVLGGPGAPSRADGRVCSGSGWRSRRRRSRPRSCSTSRGYADVPTEQAMGTILAGRSSPAVVIALVGRPRCLSLPLGSP